MQCVLSRRFERWIRVRAAALATMQCHATLAGGMGGVGASEREGGRGVVNPSKRALNVVQRS